MNESLAVHTIDLDSLNTGKPLYCEQNPQKGEKATLDRLIVNWESQLMFGGYDSGDLAAWTLDVAGKGAIFLKQFQKMHKSSIIKLLMNTDSSVLFVSDT